MAYCKGKVPPMLKYVYLGLSFLLISLSLSAQSLPSAEGGMSVWAGAEISTFNPDYGCAESSPFSCGDHQLIGIAPFVDVDRLFFQKVGVEGELRFLHWRGPGAGITESSYLAGPRVGIVHLRRTVFISGKMLIGDGHLNLPKNSVGAGNYFVFAPGFVSDVRLSKRWAARGEYEYQFWPGFSSIPSAYSSGTGGLTPNGFSVGLSYALVR